MFVLPFLVVFSVKVFNKVKRRTFLTVFPEEFDRKNTAVKKSNIYTITQSTIVMRNRNKQLNLKNFGFFTRKKINLKNYSKH